MAGRAAESMRFGHLAPALLLSLLAVVPVAQAQEVPALEIEYQSWSIGKDGVRREMSYTERVYRDAGQVWVARVIPEAAESHHDGHNHSGLGHKHADLTGAPLWIRRSADGKVDVQWVDRHERRLIRIDPPYYGNVGFSGNWEETRSLLDPVDLPKLGAARTVGKLQHYAVERGNQRLTVAWDPSGHYAREITSHSKDGLGGRVIRAKPIPMPDKPGWTSVDGYLPRDYSDILD